MLGPNKPQRMAGSLGRCRNERVVGRSLGNASEADGVGGRVGLCAVGRTGALALRFVARQAACNGPPTSLCQAHARDEINIQQQSWTLHVPPLQPFQFTVPD